MMETENEVLKIRFESDFFVWSFCANICILGSCLKLAQACERA